ncbi:uncharacterized protein LOC124200524 [Daphnia pulex]|uniref:uncharacterized protein LOC124200524 n=1 Tax=Daphnia pulex TaxID=6669 RepID=UPI001EDE6011|nr:uncharacterized protein LOC124200524 [Daphnia pulex]
MQRYSLLLQLLRDEGGYSRAAGEAVGAYITSDFCLVLFSLCLLSSSFPTTLRERFSLDCALIFHFDILFFIESVTYPRLPGYGPSLSPYIEQKIANSSFREVSHVAKFNGDELFPAEYANPEGEIVKRTTNGGLDQARYSAPKLPRCNNRNAATMIASKLQLCTRDVGPPVRTASPKCGQEPAHPANSDFSSIRYNLIMTLCPT